MEPNTGDTRGKRKAEAISPTREDPSQSTTIANDRKRRGILNYSENGTVTLAHEDEQDSSVSDGEEDEDEIGSEEMRNDSEEEYSDENMDAYEHELYEDFDDEEEPTGWEETEVEQKEYSLGDQQLTFKIFLAEDEAHRDEFTDWMQTIRVHCSYEGKQIGHGFGRYVRRNRIRKTFWRDMEEPCQDLSNIAFDLFTHYGCLRKEFKVHPIQRGTGAWGSELDLGSFFVIEDLLIEKEWRRKTIGTRIVSYLIEKSRASSRQPQFSLVLPGWLRRDIELDIQGKTEDEQGKIRIRAFDNAVSFYRSFGFRRIGASSCFGLATDPSHPAHTILPADDFDPAVEDSDDNGESKHENFASCDVDQNPESSRLERLKNRLPLHHAATTLPDSECVEFFRARKTSENQIDEWKKLDRYSNNVLHIAARELKVQTVRWLINDSGQGQILNLERNLRGYTPVEELESNLETKRTRRNRGMMTVDISDYFSGFPSEAIGCLAALRNLDAPSQIQYAQLKFGCTCGLCIDGFISPRMNFALLCQAELTCDMLSENVEDGKM